MTDLALIQHALGVDEYGQGRQYRNHFVATEGSLDYDLCRSHVVAGRMRDHGTGSLYGGLTSHCFTVTNAGRAWMIAQSPAPPRQTRGKVRYQQFLRSDSGLTFGEWLKALH